MIKILNILLLGFMYFALIGGQARATSDIEVAIAANNAPFSWREGDVLRGIDVDTVREAAKRLDIDVEFLVYPWKRMMLSVKNGAVDAGATAFYRKDREEFAIYSKIPLRIVQFNAFVHKDSSLNYQSPTSLAGLSVSKIRGYAVGSTFDQALEKKIFGVHELSSADKALQMLARKRFEVFVNNEIVTKYRSLKLGLNNVIKMLNPPVSSGEKVFLIFSKLKHAPEFVARFDTVLQSMVYDGTLSSIIQHYLKE